MYHDLPTALLAQQQAAWLEGARARLLRRAQVAQRHRVLELGCGWGDVAGELSRRCGGTVVALDRRWLPLAQGIGFGQARRLCGDALRLPLASEAFDLVYCQWTLLWLDLPAALAEIARVLRPGGVLVAIEPDYEGLIEHPNEISTRQLWAAGLTAAGADPRVGRRLPGLLQAAGFEVRVDLADSLEPPSPLRFELLAGLPLDEIQRNELSAVREASRRIPIEQQVAHLPLFLITATRGGHGERT